MNALEQRIRELHNYSPEVNAPADLDDFWSERLERSSNRPLSIQINREVTPLAYADVWKVTYEGFDQTPIHAWYMRPSFAGDRPLPCIVHYQGYTVDRGNPERYAAYLLMGAAVFAVDVRGQGGQTGNLLEQSHGLSRGWVTQGIRQPENSYYEAIIIDSIRAVDAACMMDGIDTQAIAVVGASQGGGLALSAASLSDRPQVCVAMIPNMCHMDLGILHSNGSLTEIGSFVERDPEALQEVMRTLSYFDLLHLAKRIRIPTMMTAGLKDTVCLPETIFAAYHQIGVKKEIHTYPFTGHAVNDHQLRKGMEFIQTHLFSDRV